MTATADPVARAEALHRRALGWANRGRFDLSRRQVRTALELLPPGGEAVQVEAAQVQTAQVEAAQVQG
ncbi:MAG: hypothetical protein ACRYG2_33935, partial [Janthinobacterium lividum]